MKINAKMLVYILSTSMLIFIASIGYITWKSGTSALNDARELANKNALEYANLIKSELMSDYNITKTLAQAGQAYSTLNWDEWNKIFLEQQRIVMIENTHYFAVATSWELNHINKEWDKPFGRYLNGWVRDEKGNISQIETNLNTEGDNFNSNYYQMKRSGKSMIVDPKFYSPTGKIEDQYLNSNISVPIKIGNTFIGLAGVDIDLQHFQDVIEKIKPFEEGYAFIVSYDGTFVAHPNTSYVGKYFYDVFPLLDESFLITEQIKEGKNFSFNFYNEENDEFFCCYAPIIIEEVETPWSLAIVVPNKVIISKARNVLINGIYVSLIGLLVLSLVVWLIARNITLPIKNVTEVLKKMAQGEIDKSLMIKNFTKDEAGEMSMALNTSIEGLNTKAAFASQIGTGNINAELKLLGRKDTLGKSLIEMQKSLQKSQKEEIKRKKEDQNRRWVNEGLAVFGELLRQNADNLEQFGHEIIKKLVHYIDATQGGLFIKNDNEQRKVTFDLLSAFAYDRQKFLKRTVELGEGIVGACAIEKETILLTEIPQNYLQIVSGLGGANPNSLVLVPLKIENEVLGVIEMASFHKFEKYHIEFIEKIAESIASTLKSVRINIRTSQLLEQSQQQAEEMAAQEEEMRQNMEELQATQEESTRKSEEFMGILEAVDSFLLKAEFDLDLSLVQANRLFLNKFGYTANETFGLTLDSFIDDENKKSFQSVIKKVTTGNAQQLTGFLKSKSGKKTKTLISLTPVYINDRIEKILLLALDITNIK